MGNDTGLEFQELKLAFSELTVENRFLKKSIAKLKEELQEATENVFDWHCKYQDLVQQRGDAERES